MRVLVVDDSQVIRMMLSEILEAAGHTVRAARDGEEAMQVVETFNPDIVTMDVHMPGMDGYETTETLLEKHAVPVVILSGSDSIRTNASALRALEVGAVAVLDKPNSPESEAFDSQVEKLLKTLRVMKDVKIVRRFRRSKPATPTTSVAEHVEPREIKVILLSASAGGPGTLKDILSRLAHPLPWPIVLAQHIAQGFTESFVSWLSHVTGLVVKVARNGEKLHAGVLYLPPDDHQLTFASDQSLTITRRKESDTICPSADFMFNSAATVFGRNCIAIQLSGMGRDGAEGMVAIRKAKGLTLVQKPETAMIDSMPRAAIDLGGAELIVIPEEIAGTLNELATTHLGRLQGEK